MRKIDGKRFVIKPVLATAKVEKDLYIRTETGDLAIVPIKWIAPESKVKLPGQKGKFVAIIPEGHEIIFQS